MTYKKALEPSSPSKSKNSLVRARMSNDMDGVVQTDFANF